MDTAKLVSRRSLGNHRNTDYVNVKTSLEQLQQTLTHLDTVSVVGGGVGVGGLYQGANTSTITTDSVVSCVSSTLPASDSNGKQICHNNNNSHQSSNNNNNVSMLERKKCHEQHEHDALLEAMNALPVHVEHKSPCCGLTMTTPTTPPPAAVVAANDLARDPWYAAAAHHHHHHHHHHPHHPHPAVPHQPLTDDLVMYTPGPAPASIGKFGLDTSTEGYLNARYNVNVVKGVRHERTSSFFDSIPAVTHPYYRFPTTPPAGILKKSDDENAAYCNNNSSPNASAASLHLGHAHPHPHHHHSHSHPHFQHNTKVELADSTTTAITAATSSTQLSHHHAHAHAHAHHHPAAHPHLHHQPHQHTSNLQHHLHHHPQAQQLTHAATAHLPGAHSSAFKFSPAGVIASSGVYSAAAGIYQQQSNGGGSVCEQLALATVSATTSSSNDTDLKYESPYNSTISSTYPALRANMPVDSTTAVVAAAATSSDCDPRSIDQFYASNAISTSQTVTSQRRGSLQLWQFLVALLDEPSSSCIAWTGRGMEFKLIEPEEVARRWGIQKNRPAMNYDKLSRSLRYYYEKGIMQKVNGERYVYRFVCDPDALFNMAYGHLSNAHTKNEHSSHLLSSLTNKSNGSSTLDAQPQLVNSKSSTDFYGAAAAASLHKFS